MLLYPTCYLDKVTDITIELLKENNIKGLLLDVDNTILDFDKKLLEGTIPWCENLKKQGICFCIVSNSNKEEKIKNVAKQLDIPYVFFATKPLKRGFRKAIDMLSLKQEQIAVVGDQIFTDIIGANRSHMYAILVKPIAKKDIWVTKLKRPIEEWIIRRYIKSTKGKVK